ncbi:tRNA-dihydrouridine synthase [Candidatus Falkowbacteria bacterium]|jgi:tRNA-dihydrouridine synthase B|nr:tRNA-dihydrouridine synthase [Candidatus Falkowbacteria bacterium]MBT4432901.1 tRNA-dihydrouridine synthase [Candidatus Falkowbacteria bacterium]
MKNNFWGKLNKPILALAPMAGITDSAFRQVCIKNGADVVYSEMASVSALFFNPQKTLDLIKFKKAERPYVVQLFGNNAEHFGVATKIITEKVKSDGIDINFGCPARKVYSIGSGAALMSDFKKSREVIKAVLSNTDLPVSIKIRSKVGKKTGVAFVKYIKDLDIKVIMVHGRTYEQGFVGEIDFKAIKKIKEIFPGIVLGNGGINTPEDAKKMIEKTGVQGIGLARGIQGKPWLFNQVKDYLKKGKFKERKQEQIFKIALQHSKLAEKEKGEFGIIEMRKHLCWYVRNMPEASKLRQKLIRVKSYKDIAKILKM